MSLQFLDLYGVITEILPDGEIAVCEPVFKNPRTPKKYYRLLTEEAQGKDGSGIARLYPVGIEEVNLSQYGSPVFLPAARKKVGDGKKYFILFQQAKNATVTENGVPRWYNGVGMRMETEFFEKRDYMPTLLTVGIQFPSKFVAMSNEGRFLTGTELKRFIK